MGKDKRSYSVFNSSCSEAMGVSDIGSVRLLSKPYKAETLQYLQVWLQWIFHWAGYMLALPPAPIVWWNQPAREWLLPPPHSVQGQSVQLCSSSHSQGSSLQNRRPGTIRHDSDRLIIKGSIGHLQLPLPAADIIARDKKGAHIISDEKSQTFRTFRSFDHFIWLKRIILSSFSICVFPSKCFRYLQTFSFSKWVFV